MIRPALFLGLGAMALAAPALADDPRLASRLYNASEVVRIDGRPGVQAAIAFDEDEHIENVAIGDSTKWQVTPNKRANTLFVKPLAAAGRTNMTVMTDRRRYVFDLVASPNARPLYVLQFTYPEEKKPAPQQAVAPALNAEEQASLEQPPADPADLNFAWRVKGKPALLPARIYDDGQSTYISWPAGALTPAILVANEKGAEGPVNYAVRGHVIVVEGVPGTIILRYGKDSAVLENQGAPRKPAAQPASLATNVRMQPAAFQPFAGRPMAEEPAIELSLPAQTAPAAASGNQ